MCMYIDACTHPYVHSYFARAILCNDIPYIWIAMGSLERLGTLSLSSFLTTVDFDGVIFDDRRF